MLVDMVANNASDQKLINALAIFIKQEQAKASVVESAYNKCPKRITQVR